MPPAGVAVKKRKRYTAQEQLDMIRMIDSGVKRTAVIEKYGLPGHSYLTGLMTRKAKITSRVETGIDVKAKSIRGGDYPEVEKKLKEWISSVTTRGGIVSRELMKTKAIVIAGQEGITDFIASVGWITRFCKRNRIAVHRFHGEASNVSTTVINDWHEKRKVMIAPFSSSDVFNADEMGLMFQLQSSQTHAIKGQRLVNGKMSKVRVTVLVGANMSGTEKLPLLVIGKSRNPRCFAGMKTKPLRYENNTKSWMTRAIFTEYLKRLNKQTLLDNRNILLFVDNCSSHDPGITLSNVKVVFCQQTRHRSCSQWTRE